MLGALPCGHGECSLDCCLCTEASGAGGVDTGDGALLVESRGGPFVRDGREFMDPDGLALPSHRLPKIVTLALGVATSLRHTGSVAVTAPGRRPYLSPALDA